MSGRAVAVAIRVEVFDEVLLRREASALMLQSGLNEAEVRSAEVGQLVYEALVGSSDGRPPCDFGIEVSDYSHRVVAPGAKTAPGLFEGEQA